MEQSTINNVQVIPGCISCRTCETICPSIFYVSPTSKVISHNFSGKEAEILQAEALCPVQVIKVEKTWNFQMKFQQWSVEKLEYLTEDVLEIRVKTENFSALAGQYISLRMKDAYGTFSRSYSLAWYTIDSFTLTVKLLKKWRGSRFLQKLKIGSPLTFLWGLGMFTLKNTPRRKVCIATGTWLAPMIPILQQSDANIEKILLFWARFEKDLYYQNIIESIPNTRVIYTVSRPQNDSKLVAWRVTDELGIISPDDEVYICWNPEMVQEACNKLEAKWHPKTQIFHESFVLSSKYPWFWKYHITDGNIPYKKLISEIIIFSSLLFFPSTWLYNGLKDSLYDPFLFFSNYMGNLYDISWWAVVFVMAIRPLSDIFPNIRILKSLCYFRKAFWILSATIIVSNWLWQFVIEPEKIAKYFELSKFSLDYNIIARSSEITALILLLTSNSFSQRFLWKWWKRIQRLSYVYFISGGIMAAQFAPYKIYIPLCCVLLLYFWAEILRRMRNQKKDA